MKKIEAYVRPSRLEAVKQALSEEGVQGLSVSEVVGGGKGVRQKIVYRGAEISLDLKPQAKIEMVVHEHRVERLVGAITEAARTGQPGDGKIFILAVDDAVRIRTGERGDEAI